MLASLSSICFDAPVDEETVEAVLSITVLSVMPVPVETLLASLSAVRSEPETLLLWLAGVVPFVEIAVAVSSVDGPVKGETVEARVSVPDSSVMPVAAEIVLASLSSVCFDGPVDEETVEAVVSIPVFSVMPVPAETLLA